MDRASPYTLSVTGYLANPVVWNTMHVTIVVEQLESEVVLRGKINVLKRDHDQGIFDAVVVTDFEISSTEVLVPTDTV